jgi:hypothetical protein
MRVFILESPNPIDLLQGRSEMQSLETICRLFEHEVVTFLVKSRQEFNDTIKYISTINLKAEPDSPICLHLSTHGNEDGLGFGEDGMDWKDLFDVLQPLYKKISKNKSGNILVISACGAGQQKLTREFTDSHKNGSLIHRLSIKPPKYVFVTAEEEVTWQDAVVSWTILYRKLAEINLDDRNEVQNILKNIKSLEAGTIKYFRWDEQSKSYKSYSVPD